MHDNEVLDKWDRFIDYYNCGDPLKDIDVFEEDLAEAVVFFHNKIKKLEYDQKTLTNTIRTICRESDFGNPIPTEKTLKLLDEFENKSN